MVQKPLSEVADFVRGIAFPKDDKSYVQRPGDVACLRTTNVQKHVEWGDLWFVPAKHVKRDDQNVRTGDILISTANSYELVGKVAQVASLPTPATLGAFISLIRPKDNVHPKFLYHQLAWGKTQTRIREMSSNTTNISNVSTKKLATLELSVPNFDEQRLIVAELEKQFSRLDEAVANLQRAKANLKRYKASVLKDAVEGRLVPTEAELARREGRSFETGEQLLLRILETRRVEWKGRGAFSESSSATVGTADLPAGWVWTTLGQCFHVAVGATPSRKEPSYWGGNIPWVSSGEVQLGRIRHTDEHISAAGLANSSTQLNPAGSVMIGMIGQGKTRGQAAILDIEAANNQNCAAIWVSRTAIPPEYVFFWLMSRYTETRSEGSGNNQQALNKRLVEQIPLPLPPLAEQQRIVAEVDRRLSFVQSVQAEVDANLKRAQALRQATLAKAFSASPRGTE